MTDETTPPTDPAEPEPSTELEPAGVAATSAPPGVPTLYDSVNPLVTGTGTPPTSPNFGVPRYSINDPADFPTQGNAITDTFDAQAAKRGAIVDADINPAAAIAEAKLALATDAAPGTGSRRTLGAGAQQALPGTASSATIASLVDLKPTAQTANYTANVGDLVIMNASAKNVTLPSAPAIAGSQVGVIAVGYDVTVNRAGTDTIQPGGLTTTVKAGTSTVFSYNAGVWYAMQSGGAGGGGASGPVATTAARMYRNAPLTLTTGGWQKLPLDAISFDTSGLASTSQGRINIGVSGYYEIEAGFGPALTTSGQAAQCVIYKNGSPLVYGTVTPYAPGSGANCTAADTQQLNAGDYLEVYYQTPVANALSVAPTANYLSVALLASVPGAVGPTTPARAYRKTAYTPGGWGAVPIDAISYDPGGNINLTTNRYVCPATGYYEVTAQIVVGPSGAVNQQAQAGIYKNGALVSQGSIAAATTSGQYLESTATDVLQCNAGDYIQLAAWQNVTLGLNLDPSQNFLSVVQVGNLAATPASTACARAYRNASQSVASGTWVKVGLDTTSYDTSGMVQTANGRIVCPVGGYYQVEGQTAISGTISGANQTAIFKNGSPASVGVATTQASSIVADVIQCNAGDYLELDVNCVGSSLSIGGTSPPYQYLSVALLTPLSGTAGPNTAARARHASGGSTVGGGITKLALDTVATGDDPGNRVDLTNGRYVCPATGAYQINAQVGATSTAAAQTLRAFIMKNGTLQVCQGTTAVSAAGITGALTASVSDVVECAAGDYLELWYLCSAGGLNIVADPTLNYLSVVQVGNSMNFQQAGGDLTGNYPNPTLSTQGLQKHVQTVAPKTQALDCGTGSVSFSASATSNVVTVTHNLGRVPQAIAVQATTGGNYYLGVVFAAENATATTFQVQAVMTGSSVSGTAGFSWIAIG